MIKLEVFMDILSLHRQGMKMRAISRKLGIHRNTLKKYLMSPPAVPGTKSRKKASILAPYCQQIDDWLAQDDFRATWIFRRLKDLGFTGGYDTVKSYVRGVKSRNRRQACLRFETFPGFQGQVDWADFKVSAFGGPDITLYLFLMVLGFSRAMYAELVARCTLEAFMDAHMRAFRYLGGVPLELLYDNMRHLFAGRENGKPILNAEFSHFAAHFGFRPVLCPPYSPWIKGKVERPIDYIREAFWRGYGFQSLEAANDDLLQWLSGTANRRIHGTHRQAVDLRWQREAKHLGPCAADYDTSVKVVRKVYKDCMVSYNASRYQVPPEAVGRQVLLKVKNGTIRIYDDDRLLITYPESREKGQWRTDPAIIEQILEQRRDQSPTTRSWGRNKGKATRGLVSGSLWGPVQYRPLAVYDELARQGAEPWTN